MKDASALGGNGSLDKDADQKRLLCDDQPAPARSPSKGL